jgi:hypothetical protein
MLRFILSAIALVGALGKASPAFADPLAVIAADPAQAAATTAARSGHDNDIAPAGFGWG